MSIQLRDYQDRLITDVQAAYEDGFNRLCLWLPTGAGKTEVACALAQREIEEGGQVLFLVERKTLCGQAVRRFQKYGMLSAVLRGEDTHIRGYEQVAVASIQSLSSRWNFPQVRDLLDRATLIFIDETHVWHKAYDEILDQFEDRKIVGLTATPLRDGLGLRYQTLIRGPAYDDLIREGHLVRPRYFSPQNETLKRALDKIGVASTGDYLNEPLSALMRGKAVIGDLIQHYQDRGEDRPAITFCVDKAHSRAVRDEFVTAGVSAEHIEDRTPEDERSSLFERFRSGEIKVLCSVGVLSLGFDEPIASCVILARPTLSLSLHIQQIGRGIRPFEGKKDCMVFDHALNTIRHGRIESFVPPALSEIDRHSDKKKRGVQGSDLKTCRNCDALVDRHEAHCPECGYCFTRANTVHFLPGALVEDESSVIVDPLADKERLYRELLWYAGIKNWKDGWAYHKMRERFNFTPPWAWKDKPPIVASPSTMRLIKSWNIAWAKSKQRA